MRRNVKTIVTAGLLSMILLLTAACGGKKADPKAYVQAFMDLMTRGEVEEYVKVSGESEEEAKKAYEDMTNAMMESIGATGASPEVQERFRDLYVRILAMTKYTVKEAEKTDDGKYKVDVEIEPITGLYDNLAVEITDEAASYSQSVLDSGGEINVEEMTNHVMNTTIDKLESRLESISYGEPKTVTVELEEDDGSFKIVNEDVVGPQIGEAIIDTSALE